MGRRAFVGTLALLVMSGLIGGGQASAETTKVKSKLRNVRYDYPDSLSGKVKTRNIYLGVDCDPRQVKVTHIDGATGAETPAGSDRTKANGTFQINPTVTPEPGDSWKLVVPRDTDREEDLKLICRKGRKIIPA